MSMLLLTVLMGLRPGDALDYMAPQPQMAAVASGFRLQFSEPGRLGPQVRLATQPVSGAACLDLVGEVGNSLQRDRWGHCTETSYQYCATTLCFYTLPTPPTFPGPQPPRYYIYVLEHSGSKATLSHTPGKPDAWGDWWAASYAPWPRTGLDVTLTGRRGTVRVTHF